MCTYIHTWWIDSGWGGRARAPGYPYIHVRVYIYIYLHLCTYLNVHMHLFIGMYVCVRMCIHGGTQAGGIGGGNAGASPHSEDCQDLGTPNAWGRRGHI